MPVNPSRPIAATPLSVAESQASRSASPLPSTLLPTPPSPSVLPTVQPLTPVNVVADVQALGQDLERSSLQKLSKLGMISPVRAHVRENLADARVVDGLATTFALGLQKAEGAYFSLGKWLQRNQLEKSAQTLPALLPADSQLLWSLQRRSPEQLKGLVTAAVAQHLQVAADALKPAQRQMVDAILKGLLAGMPSQAQLEERLRPLEAANPPQQQGFIQRDVTQARNSENGFVMLQEQPIDRDTRDQQLLSGLTEMGTLMPVQQQVAHLLPEAKVRTFLQKVQPQGDSIQAYQLTFDQQLLQLPQPERVQMLKSLLAAPDSVWADELLVYATGPKDLDIFLGHVLTSLHQALPPQAQNQRAEGGFTIDGKLYGGLVELGVGGINYAFKVADASGHERVIRTPKQSEDMQEVRNELRNLWRLADQNPHIMQDAGFIWEPPKQGKDTPTIWLVSEAMRCDGKAFWHKNKSLSAEVSPNVRHLLARFQMAQLMDGLHYMHTARGMVHYDLKPENFLLAPDGTVKVADLGGARSGYQVEGSFAGDSQVAQTEPYSFQYKQLKNYQFGDLSPEEKAKEVDRLTANNVKQDVYALALILREMVSGQPLGNLAPFQPLHVQDVIYQVGRPNERGQGEPLQQLGRFEKLVNAMMHPDPDKRPTLEALARHSLFDEPVLQQPELMALSQELLKPLPPQELRAEDVDHYQNLAKIRALNAHLEQTVPRALD